MLGTIISLGYDSIQDASVTMGTTTCMASSDREPSWLVVPHPATVVSVPGGATVSRGLSSCATKSYGTGSESVSREMSFSSWLGVL